MSISQPSKIELAFWLDVFMPSDREQFLNVLVTENGRIVAREAIIDLVNTWAQASWIDSSVTRLGAWLAAEAPQDFISELHEVAQDKLPLNEGSKRAWGAFLEGIQSK